MFNSFKKNISLFLTVVMISSISYGTVVKAEEDAGKKDEFTEKNIAYVGDVAFGWSAPNAINALKYAAQNGNEDLDVYFIQRVRSGNNYTYNYYNFTNNMAYENPVHVYEKTSQKTDPQPEWDKIKYIYEDGKLKKYSSGITYSNDTTVVVRDEFSSFVQVNGSTFTIPSGLTLSDLNKMLKATDGTTQTYEISGLTDTSELVAGTTYDLSVTAEDKTTKDSTTYKISVNAGGGGEIDLTIDQLKSVLKTQIAGAEALLSTVPDEKKTELEKAIKTAKDFYNTITDDTTVQQITDAIAALADAVTEAFNKESYFDVTYSFDNTMGTVQAVYKGTSTAIPNGARVANNREVTFTAAPKTGYEVKSWTVNGIKDTVNVTSKDVTITGDTNVSVEFGSKSDVDEFTVTFDDKYSVNNKVYATVVSAVYNDDGTITALNSGNKVAKGAKIKFSVNVNDDNYAFTNWNITNNGVDSTDPNKTTNEITVNGNVTAKANFKDASSGTEKTKASVSFENSSVSFDVYNGTDVGSTAYNVYAQLSATQVDFSISNNKASVEFAISAKVGSSDASANQLSKLISKLSFAINSDSTNYVESAKIENGKLVVVLKTDKIESDNISTITLNTSFNNSTAGTTNLKFKVTLK